MRLTAILLAATLAVPATAQEWEAPPVVPDPVAVTIGLDGPDMDACGGVGRTMSEDFGTDATLAVVAAPAEHADTLDELPERSLVWLCEGRGEWQGIVYPSGDFQELGDCRVSSPVAEERAYDGPCKAGWVKAVNIVLTAG